MDSFIDLFAQRKNAQEMIKANSQAEAKENQHLHEQLKNYEEAIENLRKQSLQNTENAEKVTKLLDESISKIENREKDQAAADNKLASICEELRKELEATKAEVTQIRETVNALKEEGTPMDEVTDAMDLRLKDTEELVHRENVKVYRNVQAVVQEELAKQSGELKNAVYETTGRIRPGKGLLPIGILTLLAALASLAMTLLQYFHII